jgi:hypothetical protein
MRVLRTLLPALCTALLCATFIPRARAGVLAAPAYTNVPTVPNDQSQATQPQAAPSTDQSQASQPQTLPSTSPDKSNEELPKTASPTPLIGLIGMLSLAAALGLRQFARRLS